MNEKREADRPETLWERVTSVSRRALRTGALRPIATRTEIVEQDGVSFLIRARSDPARRDRAHDAAAKRGPFLPYDDDLFVADIPPRHVGLLNKYSVIERHLLVATREFEAQERLLTLGDFEALWHCMAEIDGLAFYNGGREAGASQSHKHLQVVPLPLLPEGPRLPIASLLREEGPAMEVTSVPGLPFLHAFAHLRSEDPRTIAARTHELYRRMLGAIGLEPPLSTDAARQLGPYNLLATREWMLLVPRSRESFRSISVNALGFAGSLFVRDEPERETLLGEGPMRVLEHVTRPRVR